MTRIGSLFSGYGGLDLAVQAVSGGQLAWYSEIEPAACTVLAAHYPDVPNLGDITAVDWSAVEPVDVITGGYPCQPFSHAGKRKGTNDERHLWPYVRDAIRVLQPRLTVLENVRGHLTLGFATVLADVAELGMSARWGLVRASDADAPHGRARIFIVITPDADQSRPQGSHIGVDVAAGRCDAGGFTTEGNHSPVADTTSAERRSAESERVGTPAKSAAELGERAGINWGKYTTAINRWDRTIGRNAPAPTVQRGERDRLNPVFVEWMMGLPEGHVTGHGLSAAQELKMLGNGVVPQQAALALRLLGVR